MNQEAVETARVTDNLGKALAHKASGYGILYFGGKAKVEMDTHRPYLHPEQKNHIWACDFATDRTNNGGAFRLIGVVNEHTLELLFVKSRKKYDATRVLETLAVHSFRRDPSAHICCNNGSEFYVRAVKRWPEKLQVKMLLIEIGGFWKNGYVESFNDKRRDELLSGESPTPLKKTQVFISTWRQRHDRQHPHSLTEYRSTEAWVMTCPSALTARSISNLTIGRAVFLASSQNTFSINVPNRQLLRSLTICSLAIYTEIAKWRGRQRFIANGIDPKKGLL